MKRFYFTFSVLLLLGIAEGSYGQKFEDKLRIRTLRASLLAISPDQKQIATVHMFGGIKFYDLPTGLQVNEIDGALFDTQVNDIKKIQYSKDGNQFFVFRHRESGEGELVVYNVQSGAVIRKFNGIAKGVLLLSHSEKLVLVETSVLVLVLFVCQNGTKITTFKSALLPVEATVVAISPDDKFMVAHDKVNTMYFINLYTEKNEKTEAVPDNKENRRHGNTRIAALDFSSSGKYFATFDDLNSRISIWEFEKMKVINTLNAPAEREFKMGSILMPSTLWTNDEKAVVCILKHSDDDSQFDVAKIDVLARNNIATSSIISKINEMEQWDISDMVVGKNGNVYFTNLVRENNVWVTNFSGSARKAVGAPVKDFTVFAGAFSSDHHDLFHANAYGEIFWWDLYKGIYKGKFKKLNLAIYSLRFSADNSKLIVTGEENFRDFERKKGVTYTFDIKSGTEVSREINSHAGELRGTQINNLKSGQFYGWSLTEGPLFINDKEDKTLILAAPADDSRDFVAIGPEFHFDGTEKGIQELLFVKEGNRYLDIDSYKAKFRKRNLIQEFFFPGQQSKLIKAPTVTIIPIPNQVQRYNVQVLNEKNGIGRVEIYINGKLIHEDARKLASSNPASLADKQSITLTLDLSREPQILPEKQNLLEVVAYEKTNGIAAEPVAINVERGAVVLQKPTTQEAGQREAITVAPRKSAAPRFWALVIGVSDYANSDLNLRYAAKDAEAVSKAMIVAGSNLFSPANMRVIKLTSESNYDKRPSRQNIMSAFDQIKNEAAYDDVLLVYLAGHGISHKSDQEDFYFLTADARTSDYQSPETRRTQSISGKEIMGLLNETKAQKQVLIMDACATGTLANNLIAGRDLTEAVRRGLERMRDRTATYILAANAADQKSYESGAYGQGILTHTVLQGMRGAALREGKYVDVASLLQYTRDQVELRARELDLSQIPMIVAPRKDESFDIGLLSSADRIKIPVADPKPVFTKTIFLQANEFSDTREFSQLMDERLYELSYQGSSPPIAFVQGDYPNAYHLAGEYKIVQNTVTLNGKLFFNKVPKGIIRFTGDSKALADAVLKQATVLLNK